jgi:hypothetical protein
MKARDVLKEMLDRNEKRCMVGDAILTLSDFMGAIAGETIGFTYK